MARYNTYTAEQEQFLAANAPRMSRKALTDMYNWRFGTSKSVGAIKVWCNNRGYNSSSDGRFSKGCETWQKGLSGDEYKSHFTEESFQRGIEKMREACKTAKFGSETVKCGVVYVVTSLDYGTPYDKRRMPKRRVVWEQHYGAIPQGHSVIHLDGNQLNCDIDNLYLIPDKYKTLMAKNHWYTNNRENTLAAIKWCELYFALKDYKEESNDSKTI